MTKRITAWAIAELAHEINRAYCAAIGDNTQTKWEDAPAWQQTSAESGVLFHLEHPEATAEQSHAEWLRVKVEDGWVWGPVKDVKLKQHPCCVPYEELPPEQRVKDHLFKACVETMRKHYEGENE